MSHGDIIGWEKLGGGRAKVVVARAGRLQDSKLDGRWGVGALGGHCTCVGIGCTYPAISHKENPAISHNLPIYPKEIFIGTAVPISRRAHNP